MFDKNPDRITVDEAYELVGDAAPGFKVSFFEQPQLDQLASRAEGRPITLNQLCVRIKIKGERDETCRVARKGDQRRWPQEYAHYLKIKEMQENHTPIMAMVPMGRSTVAALQALGCMSVQELAAAPVFDNPKDYDLEIARQAAMQIAGILEGAKDEREKAENDHESESSIIKRAHADFNRVAEDEHQAKVVAFQAANDQGGNGANVAQQPVQGYGNGAGQGGQVERGADAVRPSQGKGNGFQDFGPRIDFSFEIEGIAANG